MFKSLLTAHRAKEQLIVNSDPKVYVNDRIAQYLLAHQINGVRFLYRNFRKVSHAVHFNTVVFTYFNLFQEKSVILNDEGGSGKCFQCVAFFDALLTTSKSMNILVICHDKKCLEHWQYHIDCLLENVSVKVADIESDSQTHKPNGLITIVSMDYVLNHLDSFTQHNYDCAVIQDQQLQISPDVFAQLRLLHLKCKIILCSKDLIVSVDLYLSKRIH